MNNSSYKDYLINGLESISNNFKVKTYKLANHEEWYGFERGKDLRIQIQWKGECIWEWILEKNFWFQRNTNKEDRTYMRLHADTKLTACRNAVTKKKTDSYVPKPKMILKEKYKAGHTQVCFDKMKSNDSTR